MTHQDPTQQPAQGNDPVQLTLRPGDQVEQYVIEKQLAAGGEALVFLARDPILNRRVAVKQLLGGHSHDDEQRARVRREVRLHKTAAAANPDLLLQVIDAIDDPRGLLLITEYVEGGTLADLLAANPQPIASKEALGYVAAAAMALGSLHKQDILHRDLKPANILLPQAGGLKLADFGLAALVTEQDAMTTGSVRYMAPELLRGEPADSRADLYALGMIAYELLAGRDRFANAFKAVMRDERTQAMRWMKWHTNPRTKATPLAELIPDFDPTLSALVERMTDKDPARRVASATELLDAIKRIVSGDVATPAASASVTQAAASTSTGAAPVSSDSDHTAPLPKRSRRLPYVLAATLGFWIVVGVGLGMYAQQQKKAARNTRLAATQELRLEARNLYLDGRYADAYKAYDALRGDWSEESHAARIAREGMALSQAQLDLGEAKYAAAIAGFEKAATFRLDADPDTIAQLIESTKNLHAFRTAMQGIQDDIDDALFDDAKLQLRDWRQMTADPSELKEIQRMFTKLEAQRRQFRLGQLVARAEQLEQDGERDQAITLLEDAVAQAPNERLSQMLSQYTQARRYDEAVAAAQDVEDRGDLRKAITAYREVLAMRETEATTQKIALLQSRQAYLKGQEYYEKNRVEAAERKFVESMGFMENEDARRGLAKIKSANQRLAFVRAGDVAMDDRDYETAIRQYQNALTFGRDRDVNQNMREARVRLYHQQSVAAMEQGDLDTARKHLANASQMAPEDPGVIQASQLIETRETYLKYLVQGDLARDALNYRDAKFYYDKAKKTDDTTEVRKRLDETEYVHLIAQATAFIEQEEYRAARAMLSQAANINASQEVKKLFDRILELDNESIDEE